VRGCVRLGSFLALTLTLNPSQGLGFGEFFTEGREGSEGGAWNIEQGMPNAGEKGTKGGVLLRLNPGDSQIFANFAGKEIFDFRMTRDGRSKVAIRIAPP